MKPARQDRDSKIKNKGSDSEIRLFLVIAGMLAGVTLQGTVRPQISLAMEVMGLNRDFVSLHCKKCGFTL